MDILGAAHRADPFRGRWCQYCCTRLRLLRQEGPASYRTGATGNRTIDRTDRSTLKPPRNFTAISTLIPTPLTYMEADVSPIPCSTQENPGLPTRKNDKTNPKPLGRQQGNWKKRPKTPPAGCATRTSARGGNRPATRSRFQWGGIDRLTASMSQEHIRTRRLSLRRRGKSIVLWSY